MDDIFFMNKAIELAKIALIKDEVPIGCVIVKDGAIIGSGYNKRITAKNVLYHAEIIAINEACETFGDWRLEDCNLYVTVEPCPMCAGAIVQARIKRVVYGTANPKAGCCGSVLNLMNVAGFNHKVEITEGICKDECAALMGGFFKRFR